MRYGVCSTVNRKEILVEKVYGISSIVYVTTARYCGSIHYCCGDGMVYRGILVCADRVGVVKEGVCSAR